MAHLPSFTPDFSPALPSQTQTNHYSPTSPHKQPTTATMNNQFSKQEDNGATGAVKFVTSALGNTVGGVSRTVGNVTGAATRGVGDTITGATGSAGRPIGDGLGNIGTGVENAANSAGKGVEDAGQWKRS
ncbi:hypothetical protein B0T11DRAFT_269413 [Plectosphaerella cucumerina]|uniref:Uncharacterized protein n=1 Tax=Plectosphaerella cucumerina TaxID=40658 RepID=A0A8K0TUE0_9PEZI|nr:hypothetical protein B0T11DRAFT_269413 [Plectosphaerella cucumerina]